MGEQEQQDRISNLPDDLLIRILSYLPTKEAICSEILSTRWISHWTFLPTIDLNIAHYWEKNNISKLVDSVLVDHKMPFLQNILLTTIESESVITSWISAAIHRSISTLKLDLASKFECLVLSPSLFFDSALVQLKLDIFKAVIDFPVASPNCFPKLKVLELISIKFKAQNNSATNLISSCPILEYLVIQSHDNSCFQTIHISLRFLKTLKLGYRQTWVRQLGVADVPKVVIKAPDLEHITVRDFVPHVYEVHDISSLVKVDIFFSDIETVMLPFPDKYFGSCAFKLLRDISNVKSLSITSSTLKTLSDVHTRSLPMFCNLTTVEFRHVLGIQLNWKSVISFLKSCPSLEVIIIKGCSFQHDSPLSDRYNDVPSCFISHLKMIKIGSDCEVEDIRYFLKNANILEKMIIEGFVKDFGEILNLPRASPACLIEFVIL